MKLRGLNQSPLWAPQVSHSVQHFIIAERQFEAELHPLCSSPSLSSVPFEEDKRHEATSCCPWHMITHSQVTLNSAPPRCCFKPVVQLISTKLQSKTNRSVCVVVNMVKPGFSVSWHESPSSVQEFLVVNTDYEHLTCPIVTEKSWTAGGIKTEELKWERQE